MMLFQGNYETELFLHRAGEWLHALARVGDLNMT